MSLPIQAAARAPQRILVPLSKLGLAPENLRAAEPEDAETPRLAETIRAAGLIYPLVVRKGRKGEAPFMVLDGRRRRFALLRLAAEGAIPADHPVECLLAADRTAQAAAAILPNAEHAPVHLADVIVAIGKLRRSRLNTAAIAEALGYDEIEVRRLEAMAHVHADVLTAFRAGRLTLRQVRLFARVKDRARQGELAREALGGYFHESGLRSLVTGGRVTVEDPRFALVSEADYTAAGGRLHADLFGELPAEVLDPEILDDLWRAAATRMARPLLDAGLTLSFSRDRGFAAPEGLEHLPFVHWGGLSDERRAAFEAARDRIEAASETLAAAQPDGRDAAVAELILARLALARLAAGRGEVVAALLTPMRDGVDITFFNRPAAVEPAADEKDDGRHADGGEDDGDDADDDRNRDHHDEAAVGRGRWRDIETPLVDVDVSGVTHAQHAARTEVATRGLIRDIADRPEAAAIALTAHLFAELALHDPRGPEQSALGIRATASVRGDGPEDSLNGEVWGRLETWRETYLGSGARPLAFVAGLEPEARARLLAELVAVTVDMRESRFDMIRRGARAEGAEIARLCDADLSRRWAPDPAFLTLHSRAQLLAFLREMAAEVPNPAALKKHELVQAVAEAAAARRWLPACLRRSPVSADASGPSDDEDGQAEGDDQTGSKDLDADPEAEAA